MQSAGQVILFDSVGFAIEELGARRFVRSTMEGTVLCENPGLPADPDDPRGMFGMLVRAAS